MNQNTKNSISPNKMGKIYGSPSKTLKSPMKLTAIVRKAGKSPHKKDHGEIKENKESGLASPTSINMKNSFIIKNADESFDAYYHIMKKRKQGQNQSNNGYDGTMAGTIQGSSNQVKDSHFGIVSGIQPAARDGHSTEISKDGFMFVFGGDRHLMPFNDIYLIKLE